MLLQILIGFLQETKIKLIWNQKFSANMNRFEKLEVNPSKFLDTEIMIKNGIIKYLL